MGILVVGFHFWGEMGREKECYRFLSERKQEHLIMHFQTFTNFLMVFLNNAKPPQGPMFDTKLNLNNEIYSGGGERSGGRGGDLYVEKY